MKRSLFYLPIFFLLLCTILLVLPGNEFPKNDLFNVKGLDKIIHIGLFFLLTFLFCRPFALSLLTKSLCRRWIMGIVLLAITYGIVIEFIQKYFVAFRSFELADIGADTIGAILGGWIGIYFLQRRQAETEKLV